LRLARPEGLEPPAYWFEANRSIRLSYGRAFVFPIISGGPVRIFCLTLEPVPAFILQVMVNGQPRAWLRSGELAEQAGVSTDTLRHYERLGILAKPRRSDGNYRMYPPDSVTRVRLVRQALAIGFSLPELAKIFKVRDQGGAPCRQVRAIAEEKLARIERELADLAALRDQLRVLLKAWDQQLERTPDGQPARLLESLIGAASGNRLTKET
jgi:DNA-binding transcriptional MerR regulator